MSTRPEAGPVRVYELVPDNDPVRTLYDVTLHKGELVRVVDPKSGSDHPHTTWNRSKPIAKASAEGALNRRSDGRSREEG